MAAPFKTDAILAGGQLIGDAPGADLYIDPTGDDANDGLSALTPVQSWERLFELIPLIIAQNTTVHMAAGEYQRLNAPFRVVNSGVIFSLLGATQTVYEGTPDSWPAGDDQLPFVGSTPGWTPDELIGCFMVAGNWDPLAMSKSNIIPVMSNTADTITLATNKASSAWAYPLKILRPLSYTDSTAEAVNAASYAVDGWIGGGTLVLANLEARAPRQSGFSIEGGGLGLAYILGGHVPSKHPTFSSFGIWGGGTASLNIIAIGMRVKDCPLASNGIGGPCVLNLMRCWAKAPVGGYAYAVQVTRGMSVYCSCGSRFDGFTYGVQVETNANFQLTYYTAGFELLGTCTTAGFYALNGAFVTVKGGAVHTLSGPGAQNIRLGDGTYKAYTDASASETTQFTRWIKG